MLLLWRWSLLHLYWTFSWLHLCSTPKTQLNKRKFFYFLCVWMCVFLFVCLWTPGCTCMRKSEASDRCLPQSLLHCIFEAVSLTELGTHRFCSTGWPWAPGSSSVSSPYRDYRHKWQTLFLTWVLRSELKSSCSMASTSLADLPPQLRENSSWFLSTSASLPPPWHPNNIWGPDDQGDLFQTVPRWGLMAFQDKENMKN